ncbi:ZIP Zinc transporter family protein [Cryptosporidium meleagridis]|uniref:ZIP Zinc transporter family protein n=1 Tax=Cryptosporidium meleagridis TaxID=93969 RepID=A0A2P4Z5Y3_9CRYT|nr:ZIP Zinc transporter family protein [Cryptosporidium meleagridis]
MNKLILSKILSFISVIFVGGIGVYIPIYIGYLNPILLQYINVFAGGTLLSLSLCHLIPEAEEIVRANDISLKFIGVEIPIVAYLTLFGLTIILFFEKALFSPQDVAQFHMHDHSFPHNRDHHHHHHKDPGCVGVSNSDVYSIVNGEKKTHHHHHNDNNNNNNNTSNNNSSSNSFSFTCPSEGNSDPNIIIPINSQTCESNNFNMYYEESDSKNLGIKSPLIESTELYNEKSNTISNQHSNISTSQVSLKQDSNIQKSKTNSTLNVYFLVSALSVHAIFEGMLVGISKNHISVLTITLVIVAHKWVEGIAVSAGIKKHTEISKTTVNQLLISFILMSPLGIIIGQLFSYINSPLINVVLTCISSGALLYVALGEMILDEFNCGENRKQKFILFLLGILLVSIINIVQHKLGGCTLHHHHSHSHVHIH